MLGVALGLAVAGVLGGCGPGLADRLPPEDVPVAESPACEPAVARERLEAASVRVETDRSLGTAFHIGDGLYLTAYHVVEGFRDVDLIRGVESASGVVVDYDTRLDIALVRSEFVLANALAFVADVPPGGADAWSYGFSRDTGIRRDLAVITPNAAWAASVALVMEEEPLGVDEIALFEGRLAPGDSGSAVVSACGETLALVTSYIESPLIRERIAVGVSARALDAWLTDASTVAVATLSPTPGAGPEAVAAEAWPADGRYEAEMLIVRVASTCPDWAAMETFTEPDVVLEVLGSDAWLWVLGDESAGYLDGSGAMYFAGVTYDEEWYFEPFAEGVAAFENVYVAIDGCDITVSGRATLQAYAPF